MEWKTIAIIFIILFILETLTFGTIIYIGVQEVNKEEKCSLQCSSIEADSFIYGSGVCKCYKNEELVIP